MSLPDDRATRTDATRTRIALLGATGSIGRQTVDVVTAHADAFEVIALAAGHDRDTLERQAAMLRPRVVALAAGGGRPGLDLPPGVAVDDSADALVHFATRDDVDLVVVATGGVVSLRPVLGALAAGKIVATANKETLVSGGHLVMPLATALAEPGSGDAARGAGASPAGTAPAGSQGSHRLRAGLDTPLGWLRPIDSEHSAIWQCLVGEGALVAGLPQVSRLWLTASGGPFRGFDPGRLAAVTPAMALAHPTWRMGSKITIDSATLMNKGLEVIEADRLYDVGLERIAVAIHPQSVIHSAVEFVDGSIKAQLGQPDMRIPIQYALTYPLRRPSPAPGLRLDDLSALTFEHPDETRFPALALAKAAGAAGPRASAALIAADDVAVRRFLAGTLSFPGIPALVEAAVDRFGSGPAPGLDALIALDADVRRWCESAEASA